MKKILIIILITTTSIFAQDITNKLGTSGNYDITDSSDNLLLRLQTDNVLLINGTYGTGTIPVEGAGTRMMWYPAKASFRVGRTTGTQWDDINIGNYSIAMGAYTTASGERSIAMGAYTTASGERSTAMGSITTASGEYSTAMGNFVSTNYHSGSFIIGDHSTINTTHSDANHQMTMRFAGGYKFFTNDAANVGVALAGGANSWTTISDSTKKENFQSADGEYFLDSINKLKLGSWNYKAQDSSIRHYGPMAQEIFKYFGKDDFGTIGNDTTLATADMDGIMMIAIQTLIRENKELKNNNQLLEQRLEAIENKLNY